MKKKKKKKNTRPVLSDLTLQHSQKAIYMVGKERANRFSFFVHEPYNILVSGSCMDYTWIIYTARYSYNKYEIDNKSPYVCCESCDS